MGWLSDAYGWGKNLLFGGDATKGMSDGPASAAYQTDYLKGMLGRGAPTMDGSNLYGMQDQSRGMQSELAQRLNLVSAGKAPGAGEMAVNRQIGQAQAAQAAQAATARGANAALANREAARQTANIGVSGAGQAAIAQLNDQTAASGQLAGLLGTQRSQDIGMRGQDIGVAQGNQQAQMQQQQIQLGALAQMLGVDQATLQAQLAKAQVAAGDKGIFPSLLQAGGQIGAAYATGGMKGG